MTLVHSTGWAHHVGLPLEKATSFYGSAARCCFKPLALLTTLLVQANGLTLIRLLSVAVMYHSRAPGCREHGRGCRS